MNTAGLGSGVLYKQLNLLMVTILFIVGVIIVVLLPGQQAVYLVRC